MTVASSLYDPISNDVRIRFTSKRGYDLISGYVRARSSRTTNVSLTIVVAQDTRSRRVRLPLGSQFSSSDVFSQMTVASNLYATTSKKRQDPIHLVFFELRHDLISEYVKARSS